MKSDDLNDKTETAHRLLARCRTEGRALLERAVIPSRPDGYPRTASGADPTIPSQPPTSPQDESDTSRAISYSDPTGDCVTRRTAADPVLADARRFQRRLDKALDELTAAVAVLDYQKHILGLAGAPELTEEMWCVSCKRHDVFAPRRRDGTMCDFCSSFFHEHHRMPGRAVIIAQANGKLTTTIVDLDLASTKRRAKH